MKILAVFGTRPEAIKMGPLLHELQKQPAMSPVVCVTSQHDSLLEKVLEIFSIAPQYNLSVMKNGQTLTHITTCVLNSLEDILRSEQPDLVLVHGDTTSTLAASLAAAYAKVPIGHVEAGIRSHEMKNPFPEELNRCLTDQLADLCFVPTQQNEEFLRREGISADKIYVTGNTIVDVALHTFDPMYDHPVLRSTAGLRRVFATAHRRESFGPPLRRIVRALRRLVEAEEDIAILFPVHPNPYVMEAVEEQNLDDHPRIYLLEPLGVIDCHNILARSSLLLTDSGGLVEEAPTFGVPTIIMRDHNDRPLCSQLGMAQRVGTQDDDILAAALQWLAHPPVWLHIRNRYNPYGDGQASTRIVEAISYRYGLTSQPPNPFEGEMIREESTCTCCESSSAGS